MGFFMPIHNPKTKIRKMNPITIPVAELKPALVGLGKVIAKRHTLPVLGCVQIRRHDSGQVDLTVTDLDRAATFKLDTPDYAPAVTLLLPFEDLSNVVKSCGTADTITLEASGKDAASIRIPVGGQSMEHRRASFSKEEFPATAEVTGDIVPINDAVRESLHEAMECASTDATRFIINGAFLDVSKPGASYIVGTDGRHLFSSNSFSLPLAQSLVIPEHKFLAWKGFNQDGAWKLKTQTGKKNDIQRFEITSDHWSFVSRAIDGNYPNWRQVLPDNGSFKTTISINPEAVEEVSRSAQRLPTPSDQYHTIGIEVAGHCFRLLGKSKPELPWTKIEIKEAATTGDAVTVFLDKRFLLKALRFGLTRIEIIDAMSPLKFSQGGRQMIVMPIRDNPVSASSKPESPTPATPAAVPVNPPPPIAKQPEPNKPMPPTNGHQHPIATNGVTNVPSKDSEAKPALETALVQIESIKTAFRETISALTKLGDSIRQALREQKSGDKDLQNVRQTLRSLQSVRL